MSATLSANGDGSWRIEGVLDFASVAALFGRTREVLAGADAVTLDLSGVERANSAGVALLLEWRREARRRGIALELAGLPEAVLRVARLSGVEDVLERGTAVL